jgi:calcineurin-like phosphoesterase family protein
MSKIWFSADTHFGHSNIIKYVDRLYTKVKK